MRVLLKPAKIEEKTCWCPECDCVFGYYPADVYLIYENRVIDCPVCGAIHSSSDHKPTRPGNKDIYP